MKNALVILALAITARAATIKGTVREIPHNAPIAGVQVTLAEENETRAVVFTGNDGTYEFRDVKPGSYTVEVAKPGYWWSDGGRLTLEKGYLNAVVKSDDESVTRDPPMMRPATLSGRVVDEEGKSVSGLKVGLAQASSPDVRPMYVNTDAEGRFVFEKLIAGRYVVRIGPRSAGTTVQREFDAADITKVDEDFEVTYWPGGSTNPAALLPATLPPGGNIDIGDLRPRKVPLYRALVRLLDETCAANITLTLYRTEVVNPGRYAQGFQAPCAAEYLLTGLAAGRWRLNIGGERRWGATEFRAGPEERAADVRLQDSVTLIGRVVGAEGVKLDKGLGGRISLLAENPGVLYSESGEAVENRFTITSVFGVPYLVRAQFTPAHYYAAEIRHGGRPAPDGVITPVAGGEIEIVVDDKPGAIAGRYSGGDGSPVTVFLFQAHNGRSFEAAPRVAGRDGQFVVPNLAPGTYLIHAVQQSFVNQGEVLDMETVVVRRGETTNIDLRVQ